MDELKMLSWGGRVVETTIDFTADAPQRLPQHVPPPPVVMNVRLFRAANTPLFRAERFKTHGGAAHTGQCEEYGAHREKEYGGNFATQSILSVAARCVVNV